MVIIAIKISVCIFYNRFSFAVLEHIRKKHATIESMSSRFRNRTGPEVSSQDDSTPKTMNVVSARSVDDSSTRDETGLQEDRCVARSI